MYFTPNFLRPQARIHVSRIRLHGELDEYLLNRVLFEHPVIAVTVEPTSFALDLTDQTLSLSLFHLDVHGPQVQKSFVRSFALPYPSYFLLPAIFVPLLPYQQWLVACQPARAQVVG